MAGLALSWCGIGTAAAHAPASASAPTAGSQSATANIIAIQLERGGMGQDDGSVLLLQRDGLARITVSGQARFGTQDRMSRGTVQRSDFDALARAIVAHGFLTLQASYDVPDQRDGPWATITLTAANAISGTENTPLKRVFWRLEAAPEPLKAVETAIENLKARLVFRPERP